MVVRSAVTVRAIARSHPFNYGLAIALGVANVPPYLIAALTVGEPATSLTWVAIGVALGIVSASVSAWALLVEIQRDRPRRAA